MTTKKISLLSLLTVLTIAIPSYIHAACAAQAKPKTVLVRKTHNDGYSAPNKKTYSFFYDPNAQPYEDVLEINPDAVWVANRSLRNDRVRYTASKMPLRKFIELMEERTALKAANPTKVMIQNPITGQPEAVLPLDYRTVHGRSLRSDQDTFNPELELWMYQNEVLLPKEDTEGN